MLLTKKINVYVVGRTLKKYLDLGYDAHIKQNLEIDIKDLALNSRTKVDVLCDYCKKNICHTMYCNYVQNTKNNGKFACRSCVGEKCKESIQLKYGVDNIMFLQEIKDKVAETNMQKYGTKAPAQNELVKDKIKQTCLEKYDTSTPLTNEEVHRKTLKTNLEKFGVPTPLQNEGIKKQIAKTNIEKYGVDNPMKNIDIQNKLRQTLYSGDLVQTSSQQRYVYDLYKKYYEDAELNYPFMNYSFDMFINNTDIEWNGSGHNLCVALGKETAETFNHREFIRELMVRNNGFNRIVIISSKDNVPSDEILLKILRDSFNYFLTTKHTWRNYDIEQGLYFDAENKDGAKFDFGKLRKIKVPNKIA